MEGTITTGRQATEPIFHINEAPTAPTHPPQAATTINHAWERRLGNGLCTENSMGWGRQGRATHLGSFIVDGQCRGEGLIVYGWDSYDLTSTDQRE